MSHVYKHKGLIFPSVTTIIGDCLDKSGALNQWAANATRDYIIEHWEDMQGMCIDKHLNAARYDFKRLSREALDIGSEFHDLAERVYKDKVIYDSENEKVNNCMQAFESWVKDNDVTMRATERSVYGDGWGGTLDLECTLNGIHTIVDYKTSKSIYLDSMGPQLSAYWSVTGADEAGILRCDKLSGEYEYKRLKVKTLDKYLRIFNRMLDLYFERHPIIRRRAGK